jgi:hypothetical protein
MGTVGQPSSAMYRSRAAHVRPSCAYARGCVSHTNAMVPFGIPTDNPCNGRVVPSMMTMDDAGAVPVDVGPVGTVPPHAATHTAVPVTMDRNRYVTHVERMARHVGRVCPHARYNRARTATRRMNGMPTATTDIATINAMNAVTMTNGMVNMIDDPRSDDVMWWMMGNHG